MSSIVDEESMRQIRTSKLLDFNLSLCLTREVVNFLDNFHILVKKSDCKLLFTKSILFGVLFIVRSLLHFKGLNFTVIVLAVELNLSSTCRL